MTRTALITGANRGIGLAIAKRAAVDGANVIIAAKTDKPAFVRVDGRILDVAPALVEKLPPGEHVVEIRRLGYAPITRVVNSSGRRLVNVSATLVASVDKAQIIGLLKRVAKEMAKSKKAGAQPLGQIYQTTHGGAHCDDLQT